MYKTDIQIIPSYGMLYVNQTSEQDLMTQLKSGGVDCFENKLSQIEALGLRTYAQGKWTAHQIIEHLSDAERVFQYRALRFARQDKTPLAGFDEDLYAAISKANDRSLHDLLEEFKAVRQSTFLLYKTFDRDQMLFSGSANGQENSVLALGFMMVGHALHHYRVLEERYFPCIQ